MRRYTSIFVATLFLLLGASALWATPPSTQSRYIGFSYIQDVSVTVSWINGNGAGRVVVISTDEYIDEPVSTQDYSGTDGTMAKAVTITGKTDQVIGFTTGSTRKLDISGLTADTKYYIRIYEYNGSHGDYEFNTNTATNNPRSFTTKQASLAPPTNLAVSPWSEGGLLSWMDAAGAVGYYLTIYYGGTPVTDYNDLDIGKPETHNFPILGLEAGTYTYSMQSYDAQDNRSTASELNAFETATAPAFTITSYNPNSGLQAIGDTIVILLTADNGQIGLLANGITVNGVNVASTLLDNANGTYTVTYTVAEGNTYISDANDLPLSITLKDGKDVSSTTTTNPVNNTVAPGVDGGYPLATITAPIADSWSNTSITTISGTATDAGSGVAGVEVAIWIDNNKNGAFDAGTDFYWDGTDWTAETAKWDEASGATSWSYTITIAPPATGYNKYYVQTRTIDKAGNVSTTGPATHKFFVYNNSEVWVDDSYTGSEDGFGHFKFSTIQEGVNEVASNGKVNVAAGTYTEQVLIKKSLTLVGEDAATTIVQAPTSGRVTAPGYTSQTWTADNWNTDYLLAAYPTGVLDADNLTTSRIDVKVSGFTFDANNQSHIGDRYTGVYFRRVFNDNIENAGLFNCIVTGFNTADPSATGIRVLESSKLTLSGNTVNGATIQSIVVYGTDNLIDPIVTTTGNTITPLSSSEGIQYRFINSTSDYAGIISNNTITGGVHCIAPVSSDHILVEGNTIKDGANNGITVESSNYCTIQNNTISNCASNGIALTSPWSATTSYCTIQNNTISNCASNGIVLISTGSATINNTIIKNTVSGIHSGNTSSLGDCGWGIAMQKITGDVSNNKIGDGTAANANNITNCDAGIVFWNLDNATNTANGNKIYGNTPWGLGNNSTTITIDAKNNWWGNPSGPTHSTTNPCGSGDAVSDNVDFSPWYYEEDMLTKNGLAVAEIDAIPDISTLNNTPVVIKAKVTFPTSGISDFNEAVKVDGMVTVTSSTAFPTGAVIESIKWANGSGSFSPNLLSEPYSIAGETEVYLSDVLPTDPAMLKNEEGKTDEWEIVASGIGIPVGQPDITYNLTFSAVSYITREDVVGGCNTVLAEEPFSVTLDSATISEVSTTAGCNSATVHVKTTYPSIVNVDLRILNDARITSDKPMPAGTEIAWSYNGITGTTYTLPAATDNILLSTIVGMSPQPPLNGANGLTETWDFTISHSDLANNSPYAIAFSPIAVFDGNSDGTVDEYVYVTDNVNVVVNYQAPAFTTGDVASTGGTVVTGYYNSTNEGIDVVVPLPNASALDGGTIQVQISDDGSNWENVVTSGTHIIQSTEIGTDVTVSLTDADLTTANTEFTEGVPIHFRAIITPTGECATIGLPSATTIVIDETAPTFTVEYFLGSVTGTPLGVNPIIGIGSNYYIKITSNEQLSSTPTISIAGLDDGPPTNNVTNGTTFTHVANTQFSYNRIVYETDDNGTDELITITGTDVAGNTASVAPTNAYPTATPATNGYQARVDGKRPLPTITLTTADYNDGTNNWTNDSPILATINYGEAVQNVIMDVVGVTNGTKSNFVNTGNTTFTLDVTPTADGDVTVSVPEGDGTNQIKDGGGNFAYDATATIKSDRTAPATTDNVPSGWQTADITVTFTPDDGTGSGVDMVYYTTDGTPPTTSSSFLASPYQFTISTDGQYPIKYFATDNVGNSEAVKTATDTAKLDKTAPAFTTGLFTTPASGTCWNEGSHIITWNTTYITDVTSGLATNPISLYYSTDGGTSWQIIESGQANDGSYTWNVPTSINSSNCKVQIRATDNAGNTTSATAENSTSGTFSIYQTPTITAQPGNATACFGSVNNNFTVAATGSGLTYQWQYSANGTDWSTVTAEAPTGATYTGGATTTLTVSGTTIAAGTYYYRVVVGGECGGSVNSNTVSLTVNPLPTPIISGDNSVCAGETGVVYSTTNVSGHTYNWTVTGGTITSGAETNSITVTWGSGTSGTVNVTETITATGCSANATQFAVTVNPLPTPSISGDQSVCAGETGVVYSTTNVSEHTFNWTVSGGTITSGAGTNSITVTWGTGTSGTVDVTETITATGCSASATQFTVTINPLPTPTISGNSTVNLNTDLTLTTESGMSDYVWSVGDGGTISSGGATNQIAVKWETSGTKNVTVQYTNANGCTGISANFPVTVTEVSAPVISGDPSNQLNVCSNTPSVPFTVTSVTGIPTPTLTWQYSSDNITFTDLTDGGDFSGVSSTALTVSNISLHTGYYRLWAHNSIGDDYSASAQLTVSTPETPSVSISSSDNDNTFCSGTSVTFTATASNTGGGTVAYQWKLNNGNVGTNQNTYTTTTLVNNDVVKCEITITNGCVTSTTATSNEITNIVNTVPAQPSEITGNTTVCAGTSGVAYSVTEVDGVTYTWSYTGTNATINSSGASITIDFASTATSGTLSVTPHNDCGNGAVRELVITILASISYTANPTNASINEGDDASFTATAINATSYQWQVSTDGGATWGNATGGVYSNETTTTLNLTNVPASMHGYQYKLLSSNACQTDVASNVATLSVLASEPGTQAKNITWTDWDRDFIEFTWTKGDGENRLVIVKQATTLGVNDVPQDGVGYIANETFSLGSTVSSGVYVIANGDVETAYVDGLTRNTAYIFKVFEYNGSGTSANYLTSNATGNPKYRKTKLKEAIDDEFQLVLGDRFSIVGFAPNPVRDQFSFEILTNEALQFTIDVQNEQGLTVYSMSKDLGEGRYPITIKLGDEYKGQLPAGAYFLRVSSGGETLTQKFIYMP